MSKPVTSFDPTNLLLGLAWLGELDRQQIRRLWFADKSDSTVEKALSALRREKLITLRSWSLRDKQRQITVPQPAQWSLAAGGHARIRANSQYPARPAEHRRAGLIPHDARATAAIVRLIELARPAGLSGVFIARELRLNQRQRRPVCDALVVLQLGSFDRSDLVPWSGDRAIADEQRVRYAIEADNATEPLAVIQAKAEAYRKLSEDLSWAEWWRQQYGPLPLPLWVAPTEERAQAIHAQWRQVWPRGEWYVTSDEGLADNRLLHWKSGSERLVRLTFRSARPKAAAASTGPSPAPAPQARPEATQATPSVPPAPQLAAPAAFAPGPGPTACSAELFPARDAWPSPPPTEAEYLAAARLYPVRPSWVELASAGLWFGLLTLWSTLRRLLVAIVSVWCACLAALRWYLNLDEYARRSLHLRCLIALAVTALLTCSAYWQVTGWPPWVRYPLASLASFWEAADAIVPGASEVSLAPTTPPQPACPAARVRDTQVNLRAEPGLRGKVLRKLRDGEVLSVLDCQGVALDDYTWWRLAGKDGIQGWAATNWLEVLR